ncbi:MULTISPECIES: translation initiation factor IF-2 [Lacticaseibacillus]|uniref:Translation initiation factor IF-2 n=1 Tax=Lacticaseibacillus casei DSM 20011 = JCM 1134 = ATCC 393 TaxID=1423732 RepID=A0AAD1ANQ6_LACCA|nr:translation initiation factor IF-2 [Lacticaseibacillus casei]MBI6596627.1 translation initiation factor IF-2 [Lacticaseibacillus casei]MBO1480394.1 translation initiation factor IF-2 [Lacticaseibacillus casei]MBO2415597.1 translation initiation factor IF-2 [Lacticaseibacillus casei]MCK2079956.1 translation initiation factor IF-2 [Lacticaseibacillus casei]MDZ5495577.1 translation initiation factor IF-2 [Lacticaseibacillus casei]
MGKKRVYEFAKEMHVDNKDVIDIAKNLGIEVKNHMSSIDQDQEAKIKGVLSKSSAAKTPSTSAAAKPTKSAASTSAKDNQHAAAEKPTRHEHKPARSNKTADGKIILSKSTILRPRGTQTAHKSGNHNRGGEQPAAAAKTGNRNTNRSNNNNRSANNNRPNDRNRRDRNRRFDNQRVTGPMPRAGRPTAANGNPRPVAGNGGKFVKPESERKQPKRQQEAKPAVASKRPERSESTRAKQRPQTEQRPQRTEQRPRTEQPAAKTNQRFTKPAAVTPAAKPATVGSQDNRNSRRGGGNNNFGRGNSFGNRNGFNRNSNRRNKKNKRRQQSQPKKEMPQRKERPLPEVLNYEVGMNAQELGKILHREPAELIKKLFMLGVMVNQNQSLDKDTIELLATDYGIDAKEKVHEDISDLDKVFEEENKSQDNLQPRPPVVTIMGHVDHGKTTLLDKLRHTHVTEGEAGGITQHIGAYQVKLRDRLITFLDTPGHAAFTNMRARGADITDIVVLVVAADDGVMPQTIEAIHHAQAAKAPIIVAVNKIDKPGANPEHVMEQLTEYGLIPEDWGGDTIFVKISAKFGKNIDELLEMILLEADVLELKANPDQRAVGTVIEARLDKGKGPVATVLVQQGTLHTGDPIVVGNTFGRVRAMTNDHGRRVKDALPSMPVEITGLNDVPQSADKFVVFADERTARAAGEERAKRAQEEERKNTTHVTLDNLFETMKEGQLKEVDVIIKADVQGSVEALAGSLEKIEVKGVRVNIIHQAVGAINESDVTLAAASNAIIIGFNVRPTAMAKAQAEQDDVDIRLHSVIYKAIEEVESAMKGMLEPTYEEKVIGTVTVRETIPVSKVGTVVGGYVDSGYITRDAGVRLIRDGIVKYEGKLGSLRRFKDDVKQVRQGFELGLTIENYNDIKVGDQIEAFTMEEVPVK